MPMLDEKTCLSSEQAKSRPWKKTCSKKKILQKRIWKMLYVVRYSSFDNDYHNDCGDYKNDYGDDREDDNQIICPTLTPAESPYAE